MPDPFNPQSLNRYSYCLNNPLKYIDPTGHYYGSEWYYQSLAEEADVDPSGGYAIVLEDGEVIGGVEISSFEGWNEATSYPWDYYSIKSVDIVHNVVKGVYLDYHKDLTSDPMSIYIPVNNDYLQSARTAQILLGFLEVSVGAALTLFFGVLTICSIVPSIAFAEFPAMASAALTFLGVSLFVDGLSRGTEGAISIDLPPYIGFP